MKNIYKMSGFIKGFAACARILIWLISVLAAIVGITLSIDIFVKDVTGKHIVSLEDEDEEA